MRYGMSIKKKLESNEEYLKDIIEQILIEW